MTESKVVRFREVLKQISRKDDNISKPSLHPVQKRNTMVKKEYKKIREYNLKCFLGEVKHKYKMRSNEKAFYHFCKQTGLLDKILAKWVRGEFNILLWTQSEENINNHKS